ncbi:hypothetical protein [Bacteroides oleiciplenus]|uniref:Uncharacterized protein n=2 Tax=Bacteroides oleiciplenus TaxID=626931 RepID=K9ETD0_9BACE|nr:hypothetical protein [Bacteroides oleiciplenus]EKU92405.1 hypothetical protein HMPREF9447_00062 [Bacteroides oleiciplenus YIT 12058]RGN37456.1 hypothetical protein DXB65_08145 [Bacteroides oleiciplenus]
MDRKLTGKERAFLAELAALLQQYDCLMQVEDNEICLDMEDETGDERKAMHLPGVYAWFDIEYFMNKNS